MADCKPSGHLFGADDRCLHCGDPAPQIPEFLRGAREPDGRDAEIERLRGEIAAMTAKLEKVKEIARKLGDEWDSPSGTDHDMHMAGHIEEILREVGL